MTTGSSFIQYIPNTFPILVNSTKQILEFMEGEAKTRKDKNKVFLQYQSAMNKLLLSCLTFFSYLFEMEDKSFAQLEAAQFLPQIYLICAKMNSFDIQLHAFSTIGDMAQSVPQMVESNAVEYIQILI